ncbi:hypothetical protein EJ065_4893 [Corallococcus coralloides]|uniref:Uncharacterized protein n=1 Tax=Corallococcus coralloides TaxID=184914 RepID=A0A410RWY9_CORCK|nr:hypothetical protein [Corallococcus coralloides]QAT86435.1 hypothetical protein EJ065_4893 [Corallococcus coralloides]
MLGLFLAEALLTCTQLRERRIPPCFQFRGDESIVWVDGLVAALCQTHLVVRLLPLKLKGATSLGVLLLGKAHGGYRCLHGDGSDGPQHFGGNEVIWPGGAEGDAGRGAVDLAASVAEVARPARRTPGI